MKKILLSFILCATIVTTIGQIKLNRPAVAATPAAGGACCGFRAYNSTELPMAANFGKENTIVFDKEIFDDANAFNGAAFKAPADGVYQFNLQLALKATNPNADINQVMIKIKTATQSSTQLLNIPAKYDNVITAETNAVFKLKAGEEVAVVLLSLGNIKPITTGNLSYFSGIKLY
jgi:C1q domain